MPISGRMDRASASEVVDRGSVPVGFDQRLQNLVFTPSLLGVQQQNGQCEASTAGGRQVAV